MTDEREAMDAANRVREPHAAPTPDLDDTWNVDEKEWNRTETAADGFGGIDAEDIQRDRETFNRPTGAGEDVPAAPRTITEGR